jgi:hypothetical protein
MEKPLDWLDLPRAELRAVVARQRPTEDLAVLHPSWAWVWAAEAADPASWARIVRWARQIARTGSDPAPLAKVLDQFALRRKIAARLID